MDTVHLWIMDYNYHRHHHIHCRHRRHHHSHRRRHHHHHRRHQDHQCDAISEHFGAERRPFLTKAGDSV